MSAYHGNAIIPTEAEHDRHHRQSVVKGILETDAFRLFYTRNGDSIDIDGLRLSPSQAGLKETDLALNCINTALESIGLTIRNLIEEATSNGKTDEREVEV